MADTPFSVVFDSDKGYRRLDPLPTAEVLAAFYGTDYYRLIKDGGRAPELRRLMAGGEAAQRELAWLESTLWLDLLDSLTRLARPGSTRRMLDFGCGTGHFAGFAARSGWEVVGVEPAAEAADYARRHIGAVYPSVEVLESDVPGSKFDAAISLNVFEHLVDPTGALAELYRILQPGGILVIRVPNDFSPLQLAAHAQLSRKPWWVAVPDHVNYFDFDSLEALLRRAGFDPIERQTDFPMEMFLLLGEVYVDNPATGEECHRKRMRFEAALSAEVRRRFYGTLAAGGFGRACVVLARREA